MAPFGLGASRANAVKARRLLNPEAAIAARDRWSGMVAPVVSCAPGEAPGRETKPYDTVRIVNLYHRSRLLAEKRYSDDCIQTISYADY